MTLGQRTGGLLAGALLGLIGIADMLSRYWNTRAWFVMIPVLGLAWWALLAYIELDRENDQRERILLKHGIDESKESGM